MSIPTTDPVWLFEHADRLGTTFRAALGLIRMTAADGTTVDLHLTGEHAEPLDPVAVTDAVGVALGGDLVGVRAVSSGWSLVDGRIVVGEQSWSPAEAVALAGQLATALRELRRAEREAQQAEVESVAQAIAGAGRRVTASHRAAARRVLGRV